MSRQPVCSAAPLGWIEVGVLAVDTRSDGEVGMVMDFRFEKGKRGMTAAASVWLRPPGGGREWVAHAGDLAPTGPGARA